MKRMVVARRISQGSFLALFVYILWSTTYPLAGAIDPAILVKADPLLMLMTSISERVILPGIVIALGVLALTLIVGRFFCGWVCPLGTIIDGACSLKKKHPELPDARNGALSKIKYFILAVFFIGALFGRQLAWIFDPVVIAARFVSLNMIPVATHLANSFFIILIKYCGLGGAFRDFYHSLKPTILGVKVFYFANAGVIFLFFAAICAISVAVRRSWCRWICPLGAIYALIGSFAPLRRTVHDCIACRRCKSACRMGAIRDDLGYAQGECILCMDCVYDCPPRITDFRFSRTSTVTKKADAATMGRQAAGVSRKNFILLALSSLFLVGAKPGRRPAGEGAGVIRPPASLEEKDFVNRCVRCGNCMKVCITNGLQPVMFQAGLEGVWTPQLLPEIGYCEYRCTLCGNTCPTGAIQKVSPEEKLQVKLGRAEVDRGLCLPWAEGKECIVCQEHCPVAEKAIKLDTYAGGPARPHVDDYLCVGCGICQNKCPVRPVRAIRVSPANADRVAAAALPRAARP